MMAGSSPDMMKSAYGSTKNKQGVFLQCVEAYKERAQEEDVRSCKV